MIVSSLEFIRSFPLQAFAFRGASGKPPRRVRACGVFPVRFSRRSRMPSAPIHSVVTSFYKQTLNSFRVFKEN